MMQIYVDALADLSGSFNNVKILPYLFDIEGKKYLTSEISSKDIYDYMIKGIYPKTSRPNLGIWSDMIEEDLKNGNDILYIGSTSKMTGALSSINVIKNLMKNKYPDRNIETVDTGHTSGTIDLIIDDIVNKTFDSNKLNHFAILKDTNTFINNNRFREETNSTSIIRMKDGIACLDSWYDNYNDAFEIIKAKSSNNEYMVNICYSHDMKENELIDKIKDFYLNHHVYIKQYEISPCMYSYFGLGSIGISIKEK